MHGTYSVKLESLYGAILPSGAALPYPTSYKLNPSQTSEWLPGGCLLMLTSKLATDFKYPFSGKAYCEDLFHSHQLIKNGMKLYYHPSIFALTDPLALMSIRSFRDSIRSWYYSAERRIYFSHYTKRSIFHSILFTFYDLIRIIVKSLQRF